MCAILNVRMTHALFQLQRQIQFSNLNWAKAAADVHNVMTLVCLQNLKQSKQQGPAVATVGFWVKR